MVVDSGCKAEVTIVRMSNGIRIMFTTTMRLIETKKNSNRHNEVIKNNDPKSEFEREIIDGITPLDPIIILK